MAKRLTAAFVRSAPAGKHYDEHGLYLRVMPSGSKQWAQRIVVRGRRRDLGLGGYPLVSLAEARQSAFANRKLARAGGDPLAAKRAARTPTFREALDSVIAMHSPSWRDTAKTAALWRSTMAEYVLPRLGTLPVDAVTTADVLACVAPIWASKRETARKVRQRVGAVMKWAIAEGHRGDNPAGDALGAALPRQGGDTQHHRALPHDAVAGAVAAVRASTAGAATKAAFEFLVLTAARSGEVRNAAWSEIDLDAATWTVPAERAKTGRAHIVPLSTGARRVLDEARNLADGTGLIFPSPRGRPLTDNALSKTLRDNGIAGTPHGMRSAFRDWVGEKTDVPRDIAEMCLAHTVGNAVERAYRRTDYLAKRRVLMQRWCDYLTETAPG